MANPVVHFEVIGEDGAKLQSFYSHVFGWTINADNPYKYGMVQAAEHGIAGGVAGGDPDDRGVTVYIEVPDLDQALAAVQSAGGHTVAPPMDVQGGPRMAQFADPEGHRVGLIQAGTMAGA
ncbi:MAG: VOC family protein [Candidatus Dormibacteraceae bacterium]